MVTLKFALCQKQKGGVYCGLFAIAFTTAIAFKKQPAAGKLNFFSRKHLVMWRNIFIPFQMKAAVAM